MRMKNFSVFSIFGATERVFAVFFTSKNENNPLKRYQTRRIFVLEQNSVFYNVGWIFL